MKNENDAGNLTSMAYEKLINAIFGIRNMVEETEEELDTVQDAIRWEQLVSEINRILERMSKQEQRL